MISLLIGGLVADLWEIRAVYYLGAALLLAATWTGCRGLCNITPAH